MVLHYNIELACFRLLRCWRSTSSSLYISNDIPAKPERVILIGSRKSSPLWLWSGVSDVYDGKHAERCSRPVIMSFFRSPATFSDSGNMPNNAKSFAETPDFLSKLETIEALVQDVKHKLAEHCLLANVSETVPKDNEASEVDTITTTRTGPTHRYTHRCRNPLHAEGMVRAQEYSNRLQNSTSEGFSTVLGPTHDRSTTYPWVDLAILPSRSTLKLTELCDLVPCDAGCFQLFRQYRDSAHILYPGVVDIDGFETDLTQFLVCRSIQRRETSAFMTIYGKSLHWLGLLFSCLASGCQSLPIRLEEQYLTPQVYGVYSSQPLGTPSYFRNSY